MSRGERKGSIPPREKIAAINFVANEERVQLSCFPPNFKKASGLEWKYKEWGFERFDQSIYQVSGEDLLLGTESL